MITRFVASQLRRPTGRAGQLFGRMLNRANRGMNRRAVAHLDVRTGHNLLDIGFGGGVGIESMYEVAETITVTGVDFSETMVQQQQRRLADHIQRGQLQLQTADVAALPFDNGHFDRVLSVNTVYFWPDPVAGLAEIARVLKPGGRLVLGCNNKEQLERFPPAKHGFSRYDGDDVARMCTEAGLVDLECARPHGEPWFFAIAHRPAN